MVRQITLDLFAPVTPSPPPSRTQFKFQFIDLFAGIGGFRIPLEALGGTCWGYAEIDKDAIATYAANFATAHHHEVCLGDITQIQTLPPDIDLLVGGVPCQAWSIAGRTLGFDDPRGQLWFDVCRLVAQSQPRSFLFENVKGLTEPRHRHSLDYIVYTLRNSGYVVYWTVLNSYDFGLPQDRDRLFLVGIRHDQPQATAFDFQGLGAPSQRLCEVLPDLPHDVAPKRKFDPHILFGHTIPAARGRFQFPDQLNDFFLFSDVRDGHTTIHSWDLIETTAKEKTICLALLQNRRKKKYGPKDGNPLALEHFQSLISDVTQHDLEQLVTKKILRPVQDRFDFVNSRISTGIDGVARIFLPRAQAIGTLTARGSKDFVATKILPECEPQQFKQNFIEHIYRDRHFRSLTPHDYLLCQGFPENFQVHPNPAIAKKQFGNAVSVPVVYQVAQAILQCLEP
jgi:DNA (cytosine-5)-methyltransferase 1